MKYAGSQLEIKELSESGSIEGLLAGFDSMDSYGDVIRRGAFANTLKERGTRPLPMLLHHDPTRPIGAWKQWQEIREGLFVRGKISLATRDGQEAYALAKEDALTGLSIGFRTRSSKPLKSAGGKELLDVELIEGSLVSVPANPTTYVTTVKSIAAAKDIAELLQEAGLSNRQARAAAGAAWKAINNHENEEEADAELAALLQNATARLKSGPAHVRSAHFSPSIWS